MSRRNLVRPRFVARASISTLALAVLLTLAPAAQAATKVSIRGTKFLVNGRPTNAGTSAAGLLFNSRMVQAIFDDANPRTRAKWRYPDTGRWSAKRNTSEFVRALPAYAARGLNAVTVGLQGGNPAPTTGMKTKQTWAVTAFRRDGSLKPRWMGRLRRVLRAADANGIVVIVSLFYQAQEQRLANETAVRRGVDNVVDWLLARPHRNVLIEIVNESNHPYIDQSNLKPRRVAELIQRVERRSGGRLRATASFTGSGYVPPASVIRASSFLLVHGNSLGSAELQSYVKRIRATRAYRGKPKPIVVNEDSTSLSDFSAAFSTRVSWGYHDKGRNNYRDGFQCPPVNWRINTSSKRAFFGRVSALAKPPAKPPRRPPPSVREPRQKQRFRVSFVGLRAGSTVRGRVGWRARPAGAEVRRVEFRVNGTLRWTERYRPYVFNGDEGTWNTKRERSGVHVLAVRAVAKDGRVARASVRVVVRRR